MFLDNCSGARLGHGLQTLTSLLDVDECLLVWWSFHRRSIVRYWRHPGRDRINLKQLDPHFEHICIIQYIIRADDEINAIRTAFPDIPHVGEPERMTGRRDEQKAEIPTKCHFDDERHGRDERRDTTTKRSRSRSVTSTGSSVNPAPHMIRRQNDPPHSFPKSPQQQQHQQPQQQQQQ